MTITDTACDLRASMSGTLAEMVDTVVGIDIALSKLMAARTEMLESMRAWSELAESTAPHSTPTSRDLAFRSLRAEVACALRLPERTVERLFGEARMLLRELPQTMDALRAGELTYRHAQVMLEHAAGLASTPLESFERLAVPAAVTSTPSAFDRTARRLRESLDPAHLEERTKAAAEKREASWMPARDGMADLLIHLPAHEVQAIYARATEAALRLRGPDEPRTMTQLRADVMRDALLSGTFSALGGRQVRPDVFVTVPVLSLIGRSAEPATLDGYGPIALSTARDLVANAPSLVRILTHPETGAMLSVGRDRYSVPADLKTALRVRDGTCGFFGCSRDASLCDIDHTIDWARDGTTSLTNLAFLCRGHHTVKHHTGWRVSQDASGALTWRSPAGRTYVNRPAGVIQKR